ncbi:D-alanyl-D-alanine carboxypeptidase/D-alanyl-D-alanine endopeptidase [Polaromonas eurypsychrophila]|uniref:Peptidase n=1 Tax=Polaromonas eurypsychrophila TaxID=1614635 RepID=A0A916S8Y5_9BURK|nr:D-alanyl-D-alanine carboxypeptidase/D-alanyl-D-alanine-endopeptidase [Polaromonas eurypsychrophila]GGA88880.1 peptidase [Polaromonas eurypsychrophila]
MFVNPLPARLLLAAALALLPAWALAQKTPAAKSAKAVLPAAISQALTRAQVPTDAVTLLVMDAAGKAAPRLAHRAGEPMNPASVMKLVTTYAALDLLGPDFTWSTRVLMDGSISEGVLHGNLIVRGGGDPKMVVERLQALLAQIQYSGVKVVRGDIVLDRSAFQASVQDAGEFDGEPLRPYNASPDALLINFKSLVMRFTPDPLNNRALVAVEPPLAGIVIDDSVPLARVARCGDWRSELRASVDNPNRLQFTGSYSAACGERVWPSAYADPASFAARAIEGSWRAMGGLLTGTVRDATAPELALLRARGTLSGEKPPLRLDAPSLPLREIVRDVNKFSNNVMARHLFLSLSRPGQGGQLDQASPGTGRAALAAWWKKSIPLQPAPVMDNGSGLSRSERISATSLAAMLQHAAQSRVAQDLLDSLPVAGMDATMRERAKNVAGQAFIKTGSLRDVTAVAGYANGVSGARYIVVGMVNHPNAGAARPALDALIQWAVQER